MAIKAAENKSKLIKWCQNVSPLSGIAIGRYLKSETYM